jgi:CYTH domain-containing protein
MITRHPGEGRYAREERERRWVLRGLPDGLSDGVRIADHYLSGTGLRLRRMESGNEVVRKLGQKVRPAPASPKAVKLTNMYLSEAEYLLLSGLGGASLHKTRWRWPPPAESMAIDEFHGPLAGLVMAELEIEPGAAPVDPPLLALMEVTDDDRFSGGALAGLNAEAAAALVAYVVGLGGLPPPD